VIDDVFTSRDSQQHDSLTSEEWTSVLKLSSMWQFLKIRATAIKAFESFSIDLVDKIVMARRFDISSWLIPSILELAQREKPLNLLEGKSLGMEWALKVAEVRESTTRGTCPRCPYRGPPRCSSCTSTTFNRCGSCSTQLLNASNNTGSKSTDHSEKIREVFELA
jgi:hypothetical protein